MYLYNFHASLTRRMKTYLGILVIVLVSAFILIQCNPMTAHGGLPTAAKGLPTAAKGQSTVEKKESFEVCSDGKAQGEPITVSPPFSITPINEVDDYEYSLIFKSEGMKSITKANRDLLMSAYPMDWSTHPPSSATFEQGYADFVNDRANRPPQSGPNPYATLEGFNTLPPVTENELLATYVPKKPQDLTTYNADDAKEIIDKIYSAKGLVADMKPSKTDSNVFIITGVRNKSSPINYEPDAEASEGPVEASGENTIEAPVVYTSEQEGLDPFFTPGDSTRDGKWDYTRFTPGLERSFAPNEPMQNWY